MDRSKTVAIHPQRALTLLIVLAMLGALLAMIPITAGAQQATQNETNVQLIVDSSGSMGQTVAGTLKSQMQIATESAALAISTMETTDLVEVIAFNSAHSVIVPLARNSDKEATANRVRSIAPGGAFM